MSKLKHVRYTLVQHSGHVSDRGFSRAVEEVAVTTEAEQRKVEETGGLLFDSYAEASKAEYDENFPPEVQGLYPSARGSFPGPVVDGRKIYVPARVKETA